MSTSTLDLLALAKRLQAEVENEAALRCSISRAYYAALLTADVVFPQRESGTPREASSHEKIIDRVVVHGVGVNPGRSSAIQVGKLLPKMKRARVRADYYLGEAITSTECDEVMQQAQAVMACCEDVVKKLQANLAQPPAVPAVAVRPSLTRLK